MFRITQYLRELKDPSPLAQKRNPPGPVVIWNLIRRCNLTCKHCYSISADTDFPGELTTEQVYQVMDDLKGFGGVPVLIISGGEPLLRRDIFDISRHAKAMNFYVALSTNGTLIDERNISGSQLSATTISVSASTALGKRTMHSGKNKVPSMLHCALSVCVARPISRSACAFRSHRIMHMNCRCCWS